MDDDEPVESPRAEVGGLVAEAVAVTSAGGAFGLAVGGPAGGAVGGVVTGVLTVIAGVRRERIRRAERTVEDAIGLAGMTTDEFAAWLYGDAARQALLVEVVEAAARSVAEDNVRALARVLAEGASDKARVDEDTLLAQVLGRLRPSHVQVLRFLVEGDGPGYHGRKAGDLIPTAEHVLRRLPHLGMSAVPLLAALVAEGCAVSDGGVQHETSRYQATGFGLLCLWALRPAGEAGTRPMPPEDPWRD